MSRAPAPWEGNRASGRNAEDHAISADAVPAEGESGTDVGAVGPAPAPRQRMGAPAAPADPAPAPRQRMGATSKPAIMQSGTVESASKTGAPAYQPQDAPGEKKSGGSRRIWVKRALMTGGLLLGAAILVLAARWLRSVPQVNSFIATYPGHATLSSAAPEGIPPWLGWQHFFNMFFIVLIVRTGLQIRLDRRPPAYWTAKKNSFFSPKGNTPRKVSLSQWLHQTLDVLWVLNGLVFVVLLFTTGQWLRIVPTNWDVFPNMLSAAMQYASLDWPTENGWLYYNALQLMAYFLTVFVASPLAVLSGLRMSTWWPAKAERLNNAFPVEVARAVHLPVMVYFVAFTVVHACLVFLTGALRNLNHMYTSKDEGDVWGLVVFLGSLLVIAAGWFLTKPMFTTTLATRMGSISK